MAIATNIRDREAHKRNSLALFKEARIPDGTGPFSLSRPLGHAAIASQRLRMRSYVL
jgi:hypothetical protein